MSREIRVSSVERRTRETDILLELNIDGRGVTDVKTGYGFADHVLTLLAHWAGFDLKLTCRGDLDVDAHHTVEDIGLCLGEAIFEALGDKKGIARVGQAKVPMDEAIADVAVDISGRPYLVYDDAVLPAVIAGEERDLWREFYKSLAYKGGINIHIRYLYGSNGHHLLESAAKGVGLALKVAIRIIGDEVLSTKGRLD